MDSEDRVDQVARWVDNGGLIVATSALGTGVDYPGIGGSRGRVVRCREKTTETGFCTLEPSARRDRQSFRLMAATNFEKG
ncbi:hypothetical protein HBI56_102580 [Parastagonospora nodorum]|nr:hypothetical protein HBH56_136280 [Parastagonospora nodorum]KAH3927120.1 hypothetical protein HBH54_157010 [Parastagonospora nodorum]KAH3956508.1 hypothetical protein HBH51_240890 [Parastagonospora nodorum]KAH4144277.1 hypothetical protein HBH45_022780 [Parastagonospora nodorum]KAH4158732.1 hypothetical protein HBH44_108450 [Parastagonospora nodorum]